MKLSFSVTIDIDINSANLKDIIRGIQEGIKAMFSASCNKGFEIFCSKIYGGWDTWEDAWELEANLENL